MFEDLILQYLTQSWFAYIFTFHLDYIVLNEIKMKNLELESHGNGRCLGMSVKQFGMREKILKLGASDGINHML